MTQINNTSANVFGAAAFATSAFFASSAIKTLNKVYNATGKTTDDNKSVTQMGLGKVFGEATSKLSQRIRLLAEASVLAFSAVATAGIAYTAISYEQPSMSQPLNEETNSNDSIFSSTLSTAQSAKDAWFGMNQAVTDFGISTISLIGSGGNSLWDMMPLDLGLGESIPAYGQSVKENLINGTSYVSGGLYYGAFEATGAATLGETIASTVEDYTTMNIRPANVGANLWNGVSTVGQFLADNPVAVMYGVAVATVRHDGARSLTAPVKAAASGLKNMAVSAFTMGKDGSLYVGEKIADGTKVALSTAQKVAVGTGNKMFDIVPPKVQVAWGNLRVKVLPSIKYIGVGLSDFNTKFYNLLNSGDVAKALNGLVAENAGDQAYEAAQLAMAGLRKDESLRANIASTAMEMTQTAVKNGVAVDTAAIAKAAQEQWGVSFNAAEKLGLVASAYAIGANIKAMFTRNPVENADA